MRRRHRLFWRVFLHGVVLLLATAAAGALVLWADDREPPWRGVAERATRQIAGAPPEALGERVRLLADVLGVGLAVYDGAGRRLAAGGEAPPGPLPSPPAAHGHARAPDGWLMFEPLPDGRYAVVRGGRRRMAGHVLLMLCAVFAALALASIPLVRAIVRPLERIGATARRIGAGDLGARTGVRRRDEVGDLARAVDEMAERLQRLLAAEKQLLAGVSHELRTPMARIRVALALAADDAAAPGGGVGELRARLADIERDLGDLERLVDDVLLAARLEAGAADFPVRRAPVDLQALLDRARRRFAERYPDHALEVVVAGGPLKADAALLGRVVDNLLENAGRHGGRHVALRATVGERLRVEVADDGPGLAPEDGERVFAPFFRADASRARATGGVGLGLALCRAIVRAHGGEIGAVPRAGGGVVFWFEVPATA